MLYNTFNYTELSFAHIIDYTRDSTVFAAARERNGHLKLFLFKGGELYSRTAGHWRALYGTVRDSILTRITAARNSAPGYSINEDGPQAA